MRLPPRPSLSLSTTQLLQLWRVAVWRIGALLRYLVLERQRLLRSMVFGVVLAAGVGLLVWSLLTIPPGAALPPAAEPTLATETIDRLELWLEERDAARTAPLITVTADMFAP